MTNNSKF